MKHSNIGLRVSLGFALFAFLLPFISVSAFLLGSQSVSGLSLALGGQDMSGGTRGPYAFALLPLLCLIAAFAVSLRRKLVGRWIGVLPLIPVFFFSILLAAPQGNGFVATQWAFGLQLCLVASLIAAALGFIGRQPVSHPAVAGVTAVEPPDSPTNVT